MRQLAFILFLFLFLWSFAGLADNTVPDTPEIDSVSVYNTTTGAVILSWFPCDSADVAKYYIFRSVNTSWQLIDSVDVPGTSYIDNSATANYHPELYRIAAKDFSGNISPMTEITPVDKHCNTVYIFPYQDSINCMMAIRLSWNKYIYWSEGVQEYKVFVSENYGTWSLLTTVPGNTSVFFHDNINDNTSYCYYVRAVSNTGRTSTSNQTCFFTNLPNLPHWINADYATVSNDRIKVSFTIDSVANVRNYRLYRSASENGTFSLVQSYPNYIYGKLIFFDNVSISKKWYYKLSSYNSCGTDVLESNIASNMTIHVVSFDDLTELVSWDKYLDWRGGVEAYNVFRVVDNCTPILAGTVNNGDTVFLDNVEEYGSNRTGATGKFCYYVEAVEGNTNPYGIIGQSKSDLSCSVQFDRVFIPNSFTPNGDALNAEFLPIVTFVRADKYEFKVFDRWGNKIFETNDRLKGWNGKINGNRCATGTYIFSLKYLNSRDEVKEMAGYVYLFYP